MRITGGEPKMNTTTTSHSDELTWEYGDYPETSLWWEDQEVYYHVPEDFEWEDEDKAE